MSALLQNVLASRLAQASLNSDEQRSSSPPNEEAGNAHSDAKLMPPPATRPTHGIRTGSSQHMQDDWEKIDMADANSDDEMVGVVSLPGTVPGTPHISRPPSPGGGGGGSRSGGIRRSALSQSPSIVGGSLVRKSRTDPLRSLPKEITQRIFLSLPITALISLSLVNKRYRRSATLNYCWYKQCQKGGLDNDDGQDLSGGAKWTRRASKMDWKTQYAKQRRIEAREQQRLESLPGSGTATPSRTQRMRDEGLKTVSDLRQEEWREKEHQGYSKEEMREWYKTQGGSKGGKLKGKRGKGGAKTGAEDGSLWE